MCPGFGAQSGVLGLRDYYLLLAALFAAPSPCIFLLHAPRAPQG